MTALATATLGAVLATAGLAGTVWSLRCRRGTAAGVRLSLASLDVGSAGGAAALAAMLTLAVRAWVL